MYGRTEVWSTSNFPNYQHLDDNSLEGRRDRSQRDPAFVKINYPRRSLFILSFTPFVSSAGAPPPLFAPPPVQEAHNVDATEKLYMRVTRAREREVKEVLRRKVGKETAEVKKNGPPATQCARNQSSFLKAGRFYISDIPTISTYLACFAFFE